MMERSGRTVGYISIRRVQQSGENDALLYKWEKRSEKLHPRTQARWRNVPKSRTVPVADLPTTTFVLAILLPSFLLLHPLSLPTMAALLQRGIEASRLAQDVLLTPTAVLGFPWMDVLGLPRLSIVMDQIFRATNAWSPVKRPTFMQEVSLERSSLTVALYQRRES